MIKEIWKEIKNYEGYYEISSHGRVRSVDRVLGERRLIKYGRILKPAKDESGYLRVGLSKNNKLASRRIHRLVAIHFIKNKFNKPDVNHKDGNKNNNKVNNLEWATELENIQHAFKNKLIVPRYGKDHHNSKPVLQLDKNGNIIREYECCSEAAKINNIAHSLIGRVCNNKLSKTHGLYFKYK